MKKSNNGRLGPAVPYRRHHPTVEEKQYEWLLEAHYRKAGLPASAVIYDLLPHLTTDQRAALKRAAEAANWIWAWD